MKLMDALANFDQTDRLTDGIRMWNADELVSGVAETDDRQYDLEYLLDGRMALFRLRHDGARYPIPSYVQVQ